MALFLAVPVMPRLVRTLLNECLTNHLQPTSMGLPSPGYDGRRQQKSAHKMFDQVILRCRVLSRLVSTARVPLPSSSSSWRWGCLSFSWSLGKTHHKTISLHLLRLPMVDLIDLPVLLFTSIVDVHCKFFLNQGKYVPENNLCPIAFYFGVSIILIFWATAQRNLWLPSIGKTQVESGYLRYSEPSFIAGVAF